MATKKGIWNLQQVRDKKLQDLWGYSAPGGDASTLWSWGYNWQGGLGHNQGGQPGPEYSSPTQIPGTTWLSGSINASKAALDGTGIKSDGTLWSWGYGGPGGLGLNDRTDRSSPVQVPGTTWSKTTMGYFLQYGIKTDGTLWAWGYNTKGELGQNSQIQYSSPTQIPGTTWSEVRAYGESSRGAVALRTDGTLWGWGSNAYGALGLNNTTTYSSPTQVGTDTTWDKIGTAYESIYGIKTDGTLWGWGKNTWGTLGINSSHPGLSNVSSPTQVGTDTTWNYVEGGFYSGLATKTDGTLWVWGYNSYGGLGQNNQTKYSSPVQVPGTTWSKVFGGEYSSTAIKTDGTLWAMGRNHRGELGQNNRTGYSSPVQVGSDSGWLDGLFCESQGFFFKE